MHPQFLVWCLTFGAQFKNDGHYFCRAGGNRPDGLNEPVTFHVRYLNPKTGIADKCNFCADTRLVAGQPPACVSVCPTDALKFGRLDETEIQDWISQKDVYRQQEARCSAVSLYRRKEVHQEGKA
ncbi:TPA: hypothetical protein H6V66_004573 [Escherichia coli]|nr:hypothetical protein [Salmonella enterica subsp. enterica serovar Kentucky]HAL6912758.1 hypothetical protein [Escherichia coli]